MLLTLRALLFYTGLSLVTIVFAILSIFFLPLRFPLRFFLISRWTVFCLWWLRCCCGVRCRVLGRENIPRQPGIVMCRHQSVWETLFLQTIFIPQTWVIKRELLWLPFFGWGLATLKPVAINRNEPKQALRLLLRQGCERIRSGCWLVLFPEGTRVRPGEIKPWQPGGALVAAKAQVAITPVTHNAGALWTRNAWKKYPGTITMIIGAPINTAGKSTRHIMQQVENWVREADAQLPSP